MLFVLFSPILRFIWFEFNYKDMGNFKIRQIATMIASNESDTLSILHKFADWERSNISPTYQSFYWYPFFPFFVLRKSPPEAEFTVLVKRGACQECAMLFKAFCEEIGIESRVVYNSGEDHTWNEVYINDSWVHFDSTLRNYSNRYNNPNFYEMPRSEGGWGKQISYVFYEDFEGNRHSVTKNYTNVGTLEIHVTKNNQHLKNIRVYIYSKFLVESERYPTYKNPQYSIDNVTDEQGSCVFELGENNYLIKIKYGGLFKKIIKINITLKENSRLSLNVRI